MATRIPVSYADLLNAFDWVSAGPPLENAAFIDRETGTTHLTSTIMELEEEVPEDLDDATRYIAVPHKVDLHLGKSLALEFTDETLPDSYAVVARFFSKRGAYARFKDLLDRKGLLQSWYDYEAAAVERALREWSEENGIQLNP